MAVVIVESPLVVRISSFVLRRSTFVPTVGRTENARHGGADN
ncbi:hypothetical protein [Streptomyces sp. 3214.6]|nr:hypothetical protein [Streptomyces sp. 3214.6]